MAWSRSALARRAGRSEYSDEVLAEIEKAAQEKASLFDINDSFKKVVLVRDVVKPLRDERGVVTMGVFDFLLDENSLAGI